jgi:Aldose 1-epimerase
MDELTLSTGLTVYGLRAIGLENRFLRVVILPGAGAKIWQIFYKPLGVSLLWNNSRVLPAEHVSHTCYDDVWSGGWDELFPNDEPGNLLGKLFPDHGELWTGSWHAEPFQQTDSVGIYLRFATPISSFLVERTLLLRPESTTLEIQYRFTNQGADRFPFLWKLHPAFAVTDNHRVDFPAMTVVREPEFPGTLGAAPLSFPWPHALLDDTSIDLRQVPNVSSRALHFLYGTKLASGWCGITDRSRKLATALRFDPTVFSSCWMFASHGGWQELNVAVLEPATGYPFQIQPMIDSGRARWLAPGESLETTVLFSVQEGLTSVGGIEENGHILTGDEA